MSRVWECEVDHAERIVLLCLADFADDYGGHVFPSVALVAWKCGFSVRQVQRIMSGLRNRSVLLIERESTRTAPRLYRLNLGVLKEKYPFGGDEKCSKELRSETIERFDYICYWCKGEGDETNGPDLAAWHIDRIIPASRGGKYEPSNVVLACGTCNRKRGAKMAPQAEGCHLEPNRVPFQPPGGATITAPKPSGEPSENHQARKRAGAGDKKASGKPDSPEAIWCAQLFSRKIETKWTVKEVDALKLVREEMDPESRALVQAYYQDQRSKGDDGPHKGIHRRDLYTFLNNFLGERDRASEWAKKNRKKAASASASMNGSAPKLSADVVQTDEFQEWLSITYGKTVAQIPDHLRLDLVNEFQNQ